MNESSFPVSWRGRQRGPYSINEIRSQMQSGEISGLHLVMVDQKWITVDEFLSTLSTAPPPMPTARAPQRIEPEPQPTEALDETVSFAAPPPENGMRSPHSTAPEVPPFEVHHAPYPPQGPGAAQWAHYGGHPMMKPERTSGGAIAAFVCSLASIFLSPLWPIALLLWMLSLVLGHAAISNCNNDPTLRGKGLAVAAVTISYVLLGLSLALGALLALRNS